MGKSSVTSKRSLEEWDTAGSIAWMGTQLSVFLLSALGTRSESNEGRNQTIETFVWLFGWVKERPRMDGPLQSRAQSWVPNYAKEALEPRGTWNTGLLCRQVQRSWVSLGEPEGREKERWPPTRRPDWRNFNSLSPVLLCLWNINTFPKIYPLKPPQKILQRSLWN